MKWTKDQSIRLSLLAVWLFAIGLLAADVFAFKWIPWYAASRQLSSGFNGRMMLTLYAASIFGWICLWALRKLLRNISRNQIFIAENVTMLRLISWCCAFASVIFLCSGLYYGPFFIIAVAAAFMMLIVRTVKNVFEKANAMKDELDLTI